MLWKLQISDKHKEWYGGEAADQTVVLDTETQCHLSPEPPGSVLQSQPRASLRSGCRTWLWSAALRTRGHCLKLQGRSFLLSGSSSWQQPEQSSWTLCFKATDKTHCWLNWVTHPHTHSRTTTIPAVKRPHLLQFWSERWFDCAATFLSSTEELQWLDDLTKQLHVPSADVFIQTKDTATLTLLYLYN